MSCVCRTLFQKEIVTEFVPPKNRKSKKIIIFCSGVPSDPCKDEVLEFWASKGYWTFFPRYRGTWESKGTFLKESLEKDVFDVIESIKKPFKDIWSGKTYRVNAKQINIFGSSFGGPAAILATLDPRIHKVVCIAPVVDWVQENKADPLSDLYKLLMEGFAGAYRLNKQSWNKLARGKFYNPAYHTNELDGNKIMIIHAEDDDVVRYKPVARFSAKINCEFISFKKGGHLSSSLTMKNKLYWKIRRFLNDKRMSII